MHPAAATATPDLRHRPSSRPSCGVATADAIFERLYDIVSLKMPPGVALQEKRIAEDFAISRTPVREPCFSFPGRWAG